MRVVVHGHGCGWLWVVIWTPVKAGKMESKKDGRARKRAKRAKDKQLGQDRGGGRGQGFEQGERKDFRAGRGGRGGFHGELGSDNGRRGFRGRGGGGGSNGFRGNTIDPNGFSVQTEEGNPLNQMIGEFGQTDNEGVNQGGFRGRGSGRGDVSSREGVRFGRVNKRRGYVGYPGWHHGTLHTVLHRVLMQKGKPDWDVVGKGTGHAAEECKNVWDKLQKDLKPVTVKSALDSVKILLMSGDHSNKLKQLEAGFKYPAHLLFGLMKNGVNLASNCKNLTPTQLAELAPLQNDYAKKMKQNRLDCFNYYKENLEEFKCVGHEIL